jgi:hypothetical protein
MSAPTTSILLNQVIPAAPTGDQNVTFVSDSGTPLQSITAYPKKATTSLRGAVKPDGTTITVDGTGKISASAVGLGIPSTTPVPRGSTGGSNGSSSPVAVSFPSGFAVGDTAFIFLGTNWTPTTPSGWTLLPRLSNSFSWQVYIYQKTLSSGDGSSVSIALAGSGFFKAAYCCNVITGAIGGIRYLAQAEVNQFTSTSQIISTDTTPLVGDYAMYFGANQLDFGSVFQTVSRGSTQQTNATMGGSDWAALFNTEVLTSSGSVSTTFGTGSGSSDNGAYGGILVVYGVGSAIGSVTSVALSMPTDFTVSGSPVTGAGAFTVTGGVTKSGVQQEAYTYAADTGTANAYAVALTPAPTLVAGSAGSFLAAHANTGASTLAINGGTAIAITKNGNSTALASGDIAANQIIDWTYDGSVIQILVPGSGGGGAVSSLTTTGSSGAATLSAGVLNIPVYTGGGGGGGLGAAVKRSTTQSIPNSTTTNVSFDSTAVRDDGGFYSSGAPTKLTVPTGKSGWYIVTANIGWNSFAGTTGIAILVNGTTTIASSVVGTTGTNYTQSCAGVYYLNAGDYLTVPVNQYVGSSQNLTSALFAAAPLAW